MDVSDADIKFLVKFGKRKNIEGIANGMLYFTNAKRIWEIEKEQGEKGQGDECEGKMRAGIMTAYGRNTTTNAIESKWENQIFDICFDNVHQIPVFCLTVGYTHNITMNADGSSTIHFDKRIESKIRNSFSCADSALIIKKPQVFIDDIIKHFKGKCEGNAIHYYEGLFDGNITREMLNLITEKPDDLSKEEISMLDGSMGFGEHIIQDNTRLITSNSAYKILFCKDKQLFSEQQEYRFVAYGERIERPKTYNIMATEDAELVDIDTFFNDFTFTM